MSSEDEDFVEIPDEMFDEDADEAVLSPVFVGYRMEAELVRSLLEANEIPAVVFGMGGFAFGAEEAGPNERVMVRSDHFEAALSVIRDADITEGQIIEEVDEEHTDEVFAYEVDETEFEQDGRTAARETEPIGENYDPDEVPVLAGGSDWGPRIAGLLGVAALVTAIIVIIQKA